MGTALGTFTALTAGGPVAAFLAAQGVYTIASVLSALAMGMSLMLLGASLLTDNRAERCELQRLAKAFQIAALAPWLGAAAVAGVPSLLAAAGIIGFAGQAIGAFCSARLNERARF